MNILFQPIGLVKTEAETLPRHWSVSDIEGSLIIRNEFIEGLRDIRAGQKIVVLFYFHNSPAFHTDLLTQTPPHKTESLGVFSTCSPRRPNAVGLSVLDVSGIQKNEIQVRGIDMMDGTPILDIKPHIAEKQECPSHREEE
jgi:tRNA-Thr(GGU) m(6)t(6)A37 methyltransferase TsaA